MEEYKPNSHRSKEETKRIYSRKTCRESNFRNGEA